MTELPATLAHWAGAPPTLEEWMDGRASILRYHRDDGSRIVVASVFSRPTEQLGPQVGVMATSSADAMQCAVTAAADMAFHVPGANISDLRERATSVLADPTQLGWQPTRLRVDDQPVRSCSAVVLDSAVAAHTESVHQGMFIGVAVAPLGAAPEVFLLTVDARHQ